MFERSTQRNSGPPGEGASMRETRLTPWIALALVLACASPSAVWAQAPAGHAVVKGVIHRAPDGAPLAGARLWLADRKSGRMASSDPTAGSGAFVLRGLEPGTYEVAVESGRGLYPISAAIQLASDSTRVMRIDVQPAAAEGDPAGKPAAAHAGHASIWSKPFTASLLVLGAAVLVDVVVANATDEALGTPEVPPPSEETDTD
jgi:hypothetical protein